MSSTPYLRNACAVPRSPLTTRSTAPASCTPVPVSGMPSGTRPALRRLLAAAGRVDDRAVARLITDALETDGALATWQTLGTPALAAVTGPAPALALTAGLRAALDERLTRLARAGRRPTVMLAAAPGPPVPRDATGSRGVTGLPGSVSPAGPTGPAGSVGSVGPTGATGELPLAVLAVVLLEHGVESWRFGGDLPWSALSAAAARVVPARLVVWSSVPSPGDVARRAGLEAAHPTVTVVPAGPGWAEAMSLSAVVAVCLAPAGPR